MGIPDSPSDHGSDRHGHVEATFYSDPPPQELVDDALATECPDCNVNVFLEEVPGSPGTFLKKVAHDETCPWLTAQREP